jgi:ribonuclease HII
MTEDPALPPLSFADDGLETALRARLGPRAPVCGVDEAGRGPWAGPVFAAAVSFEPGAAPEGLADSKMLTAARREALALEIKASAVWAVAFASVEEIDGMGLGRAADLAMARAVAGLSRAPAFALVDGNRTPRGLGCDGEAVVKGDARSVSIAAASILAKTARDLVMEELAAETPGYGWERNRGYGTPEHVEGLKRLGVTQHHRRSFRPIHNILLEGRTTTD